jgi:hypothetical protein
VGFGNQLGAGVLRHDHLEAEVGHLAGRLAETPAVLSPSCSSKSTPLPHLKPVGVCLRSRNDRFASH